MSWGDLVIIATLFHMIFFVIVTIIARMVYLVCEVAIEYLSSRLGLTIGKTKTVKTGNYIVLIRVNILTYIVNIIFIFPNTVK